MENKSLAISKVEIDSTWIFLVYDINQKRLIPELSDYARNLAVSRRYSELTVGKRIGQLALFWCWLQENGLPLHALSDESLIRFRDEELKATLAQAAARGSKMTAMRTVNDKLRTILAWLKWMTGVQEKTEVTAPVRRGRSLLRARSKLNILFSTTGTASKHGTAFVVDEQIVGNLHKTFFRGGVCDYVAHRNALWAEIAEAVGFRRASICSLSTDQFDRSKIERESSPVVLLIPRSQKFGYRNDFQFPVWLAMRVCDFIDDYLHPMLAKKGIPIRRTCGKLFVSSRDGSPLTNGAMTHIMSVAMRKAGAPKGVAGHALRAKFCNDAIRSEYDTRVERGMDTSTLAIATAVAWRMGHRRPDSLYPYVASFQSKQGLLVPTQQSSKIRELECLVEQLRQELELARNTYELSGN